jgi:hypothetical protein
MPPPKNLCKIAVDRDEEKIAQLLTRDAWRTLNARHVEQSPFSTAKIPRMPIGGYFEFIADSELLRYYLDQAEAYQAEMTGMGWGPKRYQAACRAFKKKVSAAAQRNLQGFEPPARSMQP